MLFVLLAFSPVWLAGLIASVILMFSHTTEVADSALNKLSKEGSESVLHLLRCDSSCTVETCMVEAKAFLDKCNIEMNLAKFVDKY